MMSEMDTNALAGAKRDGRHSNNKQTTRRMQPPPVWRGYEVLERVWRFGEGMEVWRGYGGLERRMEFW